MNKTILFIMIMVLCSFSVLGNLETEAVGAWLFDGDATDETPNGNDGVVTGATNHLNYGFINEGYLFDASTEKIIVQDDGSGYSADTFSIGFWIYPTGSNLNSYVIGKRTTSHIARPFNIYVAGDGTNNNLNFYIGDGSTQTNKACDEQFKSDVWTYIMITFNTSNNEVKYYYNGTQVGLTESNTQATSDANDAIYITNHNSNGAPYYGYLDEITIWNTTLSGDEASSVFEDYIVGVQFPFSQDIILSDYNLTSDGGCTVWNTNQSNPCNTTDKTPTITLNSSVSSNCSIQNITGDYNSLFDCSTTGGVSHICTLYSNQSLIYGLNNLTISCNNTDGLIGTSGDLIINYTVPPLSVSYTAVPYDGAGNVVSSFSDDYLSSIEGVLFNFSFNKNVSLFDWYFNFSAGGTAGCSLGNHQESHCFQYPEWVQFIQGNVTSSFDDTYESESDRIIVNSSGSDHITLFVDEHYNPNVYKKYPLNFSDVVYQTGADVRLTKNNVLRISINGSIIPTDADAYKLDFRVSVGGDTGVEVLEAYFCNSSYVVLRPSASDNCVLVAEKNSAELVNEKFRGLFNKGLITGIGELKYVVLQSRIPNSNNYFAIKTLRALDSSNVSWEYSNNQGLSWTDATIYESEVNINWFYDGNNKTNLSFNFVVEGVDSADSGVFGGGYVWDINATKNYPPIGSITAPVSGESISFPYELSGFVSDANNDTLNISIGLFNGSVLYKWVFTDVYCDGFNCSSPQVVIWDDTIGNVTLDLVRFACELNNTELYCVNDTITGLLINYQVAENTLECFYDNEPYYMFDSFEVLCVSSLINASCFGRLYSGVELVQAVPKRVITASGEVISSFFANEGNVIIKFSNDNIKSGVPLNMSITCTDSSHSVFFNATITPELRVVADWSDPLIWIKDNSNYLVAGGFFIAFLIVLFSLFLGVFRK